MRLKIESITKFNGNYIVSVEGSSDLIKIGVPCNNGENIILGIAMKGGTIDIERPMFESTWLLVSGELKDKKYLTL